MTFISKNTIRPAIVSILCFLFLVLAAYKYADYKKGLWEKDVRDNLLELLISKKSKLEKALYSRIYYTKGVASFVSLKPDITYKEYNMLARDLIREDTLIGSMALSKDCIISYIYPTKGHEKAIGLNLLEHPERKEIVDKTIQTRKTFVAGPVELIEGGTAFISYTPIFDKTISIDGKFWGITDIVILMKPLLNEAGIINEENNVEFSLKGYNGTGTKGKTFYGNSEIFNKKPVSVSISLPYGSWILAAAPKVGWNAFYNQDKIMKLYLIISSLVISFLIGLVSYNITKVSISEKKLKAIFGSLDSLIFEYDKNGIYKEIAATKLSLLIKPPKELLGKSVKDVFENEVAQQILLAIDKCILTNELVIIEYPIILNGSTHWFQGRLSYKNNDSVILNAIDITSNKRNAEELKESEVKLRRSNTMKDKLFAVLSHDLRNSLGSFNQIIDLLVNEYDEFSELEKRSKLVTINNASREVYDLLENILEWQIIQSKSSEIQLEKSNIKEISEEVVMLHNLEALKKNISIINNIPDDTFAFFNEKLFSSTIRNLLSNAIKFSHPGGIITIYCELLEKNEKQYVAISIEDNGIGIQQNKVDDFNSSTPIPSSHGTSSEKGSGLGLVLCQEFVEMQGGELYIKSEINEGSTFTFTLKA